MQYKPKILIKNVPASLLTPGLPVIWTYFTPNINGRIINCFTKQNLVYISIDFSFELEDHNALAHIYAQNGSKTAIWLKEHCSQTYVYVGRCKRLKEIYESLDDYYR